jgi:integrase
VSEKIRAGYAPKTVVNHLLVLQVVLKRAVRWRLIGRNPVVDCERPRVAQPELNVLSEVEVARLWGAYGELETEAGPEEKVWWRLARTLTFVALGTALRRGELLALRWRDVQLLEGQLTVREALVKGRLTTPKSRSSRRLLELGPRTRELLAEHWSQSAFQGDEQLVFCHPLKGTPLDPLRLASCYLRPALLRAGVGKPFRPFHDLRHTRPHARGGGRKSNGVRPAEGRPLAERDHGALYPCGAGPCFQALLLAVKRACSTGGCDLRLRGAT